MSPCSLSIYYVSGSSAGILHAVCIHQMRLLLASSRTSSDMPSKNAATDTDRAPALFSFIVLSVPKMIPYACLSPPTCPDARR